MSDSEELGVKERKDTELRFRMREEDALERFLDAWRTLPPLVRAAEAEYFRQHAARQAAAHRREEENTIKTGLPRRAAVNRAFVIAETALHQLWCELCNVADEEADSFGQGPLVRAPGLEHPPIEPLTEEGKERLLDAAWNWEMQKQPLVEPEQLINIAESLGVPLRDPAVDPTDRRHDD